MLIYSKSKLFKERKSEMKKTIKQKYKDILLIIFFFVWVFNVFVENERVSVTANIIAIVLISLISFIKYYTKDD